jgi:hypothetical protein
MKGYQFRSDIFLITLITTLLMGCMGGGTIGTGVSPMGFGTRQSDKGISFTLVGTVKDSKRQLLSGANVRIETSFGIVNRTSDQHGQFRAPITIKSGEYVKIELTHKGTSFRSSEQISPAGAKEVHQNIIIEGVNSLAIE